jgi:hypothetical protein
MNIAIATMNANPRRAEKVRGFTSSQDSGLFFVPICYNFRGRSRRTIEEGPQCP